MREKGETGVIGLAVMGQNLCLNMNDHGYKVIAFNRTWSKVENFLKGPAKDTAIVGANSLTSLVNKLKRPRKIMLMVRAGEVVDTFVNDLSLLLDEGDIIIDGGNSNYGDTVRRVDMLEKKGILFVGAGVSGGEEGARRGPSIMPGGNPKAWPEVKGLLQDISARALDGEPCCDWVGPGGAGHFVKMVHNGIEYGDMQLISEAYQFMRDGLKLTSDEMADIFRTWNKTELDSYLIEITADLLNYREKESGAPLIDNILDAAGQKGTGKWTGMDALDKGIPLTLITEAVFARCISALKEERVAAARIFEKKIEPVTRDREQIKAWVEMLREALLASKIISYAQGFMLMREASKIYKWDLNYTGLAKMWRAGCIIRSAFLSDIADAFTAEPDIPFLGSAPWFRRQLTNNMASWRKIVVKSVEIGLPMPAMTSAITFLDGYTCASLPANMIQAQRDFFGAHTYERVDKPRGEFFHTDWSGHGGKTSSTTYEA